MKTKLILLIGAAVAACSLSSCEVGYPGAYGYGGAYAPRATYYRSSYYSRPLLSYNNFNGGFARSCNSGFGAFSRPYSSFGNFGNGHSNYCAPVVSHVHHSGFNRGFGNFSPFGVGPSFGRFGGAPIGGFGGCNNFGRF